MLESMEVDSPIAQDAPLRPDQVRNAAGGFVWTVDDFKRFHRFLVLGSELPTYYTGERVLGKDNALAILRLIGSGRGVEVVEDIVKFSVEGRTSKQGPIMFSLAMCARSNNLETKQKAYEVLSEVCRIPTHLFMFVDYCKKLSTPTTGWGRAHRKAIKKWYTSKTPMKLARHVTKYQKREGWSHGDVVRLTHLKPEGDELKCIMTYIIKGWEKTNAQYQPVPGSGMPMQQGVNHVLQFLQKVEEMKRLTEENVPRIVELIEKHELVREHVPTKCLNLPEVWDALLKKMPMTAMLRNLGKMTKVGLLAAGSNQADMVCDKLRNEEFLEKARIHPFNVLLALKQYAAGHGDRGSLRWSPNTDIYKALESAFYLSFKNVKPTDKRFLLALDVSGSMSWGGCNGSPSITPAMASAAMAMVTARTEQHDDEQRVYFVAFSHKIVPVNIKRDMRIEEVLAELKQVPMGGTDCALPMTYAMNHDLEVDVFIVYTDCETKSGAIHPSKQLQNYREHSGINAKLIVVAMTSNGFTIADPEDRGMFDVAGFDSAAPQAMNEFVLGTI